MRPASILLVFDGDTRDGDQFEGLGMWLVGEELGPVCRCSLAEGRSDRAC